MLRIIGGEFRSRLIETPQDASKTRPLPDRVRVSMHNMLNGHYEGQWFLDVFAGTGVFGLECLSRGAAGVVFVERDRDAGKMLKRNIETLGVGDRCRVVQADALGPVALAECPRPVHVVFFDPPYPIVEDPEQRQRVFTQFTKMMQHLDDDGFAIIRTPWPFVDVLPEDEHGHRPRSEVELSMEGADGPETHEYGSTAVHWYAKKKSS